MTLELDSWYPQAHGLSVGQRKRVDHMCGPGRTLSLWKDEEGYHAHCFRCGEGGVKLEQEDLSQKIARLNREAATEAAARESTELPEPRVYNEADWPPDAALWFYKQGFSHSLIRDIGLYWCPDLGRVVLPIKEDGRVVFWLARSTTRTPKWIGPAVDKRGLTARYGVGKGDCIVLTEDALSAYKVGRVTEAWSLLGTSLHPRVLLELKRTGKRVVTWLDDDRGRANGSNPGQEAAAEIRKALRGMGVEVANATSPKDPKCYGPNFLAKILEGVW